MGGRDCGSQGRRLSRSLSLTHTRTHPSRSSSTSVGVPVGQKSSGRPGSLDSLTGGGNVSKATEALLYWHSSGRLGSGVVAPLLLPLFRPPGLGPSRNQPLLGHSAQPRQGGRLARTRPGEREPSLGRAAEAALGRSKGEAGPLPPPPSPTARSSQVLNSERLGSLGRSVAWPVAQMWPADMSLVQIVCRPRAGAYPALLPPFGQDQVQGSSSSCSSFH